MSILNGFFYIILYSFMGWLAEVSYWFIQEGYFINRGFLTGPLCPMYGIGALFAVKLLERYRDNSVAVFFGGVALSALLEQTTSFVLEQMFDLVLWDYSYSRWNINGRLSVKNLFLFGMLAVVLVRYIHPIATRTLEKIPRKSLKFFLAIMAIYLCLDIGFTTVAMNRINDGLGGATSTDIHILIRARRELIEDLILKSSFLLD